MARVASNLSHPLSGVSRLAAADAVMSRKSDDGYYGDEWVHRLVSYPSSPLFVSRRRPPRTSKAEGAPCVVFFVLTRSMTPASQ